MRITPTLLILAALTPLTFASPAAAAVRACAPPVIGQPQAAPTELQARKQALEAWAKAAGTVPSAWRLAVDKRIACTPIAGQSGTATTCVVRARPCLIDQVPGRDAVPAPPSPTTPAPLPRPRTKTLNI